MKSERLLSLDILRGITVAGMILVNNPGDWGHIFAPLRHAEWHGLTPTDLVFPFFVFIMGVSMSFSLSKFNYSFSLPFGKKILVRAAVLFLLGVLLSWIGCLSLHEVRILGVLQRLSLTFFLGSLLVVLIPRRSWLVPVAMGLLVVYYLILTFGNGFELTDNNVIARVDRALFGDSHVYREWLPDGGRILFDPEGLLSTIPAISHVILGFLCGELLILKTPIVDRLNKLSIAGISLLFIGFLLSYGCPLNKKIWSPTFVLVTCGLAILFLVILIWLVDIKKKQNWSMPFQAFGTNPLFIYVFAGVMAMLYETIPVGDKTLQEYAYTSLLGVLHHPELASCIFALLFVAFNGLLAILLFRKRIFIKI